jgi:hypothetical protein
MIVHAAVLLLMITTASAFLILWYFWVKKRVEIAQFVEDGGGTLLPFRYFCWVLLGLLAAVSLAQVHFVRVSALVHERLGEVAGLCRLQTNCAAGVDEVKSILQSMKEDISSHGVKNPTLVRGPIRSDSAPDAPRRVALTRSDEPPEDALVSFPPPEGALGKQTGFAKEAKTFNEASTGGGAPGAIEPTRDREKAPKSWSMSLSLSGKTTAESLRVRRSPAKDAEIVERLPLGSEVKITEKLLQDSDVWFRVVTPSGGAGWVDFKYIRLPAASKSAVIN